MAIIPPSPYNFYHEEIAPELTALAHKKGIIGYTGDNNISNKSPLGKPIYKGFEKNTHLSQLEHRQAAETLNNRANRIKQHLKYKHVAPEELPVLQQQLSEVEKQRDSHSTHSMQKTPVSNAVPVKKSEGSKLSKLLKTYRATQGLGR
jgi:hypothetical protein